MVRLPYSGIWPFCEMDWYPLGVRWPNDRSWDSHMVQTIRNVVTGDLTNFSPWLKTSAILLGTQILLALPILSALPEEAEFPYVPYCGAFGTPLGVL